MSLAIVVDGAADVAPYQQVFEQIRAAIERRELSAGDVLPTVRQLAGDLGLAPNTVARAYTQLQAGGWIVSEGRRGTQVAGSPPSSDGKTRSAALVEAIAAFAISLERRGYTPTEIRDELGRHA